MVKAWIAREWRNGKTDGAALEGASSAVAGAAGLPDLPEGWSAEGWDENMLALCESFFACRSRLAFGTDIARLASLQSRPTLALASPARILTHRTSTSSLSPSRSTTQTLRSPAATRQARSAASPTPAWTSTLQWIRATFRARASSATSSTAAAAALVTVPILPAGAEAVRVDNRNGRGGSGRHRARFEEGGTPLNDPFHAARFALDCNAEGAGGHHIEARITKSRWTLTSRPAS